MSSIANVIYNYILDGSNTKCFGFMLLLLQEAWIAFLFNNNDFGEDMRQSIQQWTK